MRKIPARKRVPIQPSFAGAQVATRHVVAHHGIPVGQAHFVAAGLVIADLEVLDGYTTVRDAVRAASEVLWALGFFGYRGASLAATPEDTLARAASLDFEIRDTWGNLVHADWVNLIERPGPVPAPVLVARFRLEHGGVPAEPEPMSPGEGKATDT